MADIHSSTGEPCVVVAVSVVGKISILPSCILVTKQKKMRKKQPERTIWGRTRWKYCDVPRTPKTDRLTGNLRVFCPWDRECCLWVVGVGVRYCPCVLLRKKQCRTTLCDVMIVLQNHQSEWEIGNTWSIQEIAEGLGQFSSQRTTIGNISLTSAFAPVCEL